MSLISEAQIRNEIAANKLLRNLPRGLDQVKGCAVDLTIGDIFVPGAEDDTVGSPLKPRKSLSLSQGMTAIVRTSETFELTASQAAVVFPASSVSVQGLIVTNPGHVDPGYVGHIHVTVINFASEPYSLERGGRLLRALFFEQKDLALAPRGALPSPITDELVQKLSEDFMDIEKRTISHATRAVELADRKARLWGQYVPFFVAIIGVMGGWYYNTAKVEERMARIEAVVPTNARIDTFAERISKMEALVPTVSRLDALETMTIPNVKQRIRELEATVKKNQGK